MSFLPLTLGIGFTPGAGSGKPPTKAEADKILNRDGFSCRFCGFTSHQFQRVVPFQDGPVTACGFCEQVLAIERSGLAGTAVLIWLPEIAQTDLNHIARAIYVARADENSEIATLATRALDALMTRRTDAKKRLGSDDPLVLATILQENLSATERAAAIQKLDGVRVMPIDKVTIHGKNGDVNGFPRIVKFWRSPEGPFAKLPTGEWQNMFTKLAA